MLGGTVCFGVDRLVAPLGYRPLSQDDAPLPTIEVPHLHHAEVQLMTWCADLPLDLPTTSDAFARSWSSRVVY